MNPLHIPKLFTVPPKPFPRKLRNALKTSQSPATSLQPTKSPSPVGSQPPAPGVLRGSWRKMPGMRRWLLGWGLRVWVWAFPTPSIVVSLLRLPSFLGFTDRTREASSWLRFAITWQFPAYGIPSTELGCSYMELYWKQQVRGICVRETGPTKTYQHRLIEGPLSQT